MPTASFTPGLLLAVAVGSAVGGVARYALTLLVQRDVAFPVGTLLVNVLGCLIIGMIFEYASTTGRVSPEARVLLTSGFCGGFTTFSTFSVESVELLGAGLWQRASLYVCISVLVGLGAVWAGGALVRAALSVAPVR